MNKIQRLQCEAVEWWTPQYILDCARAYFGGEIPFDPATSSSNPTRALRFLTPENDGLWEPWGDRVFVNPPYGKVISEWCQTIHHNAEQGGEIIALLPCGARFSTKYWQRFILARKLSGVCFVNHRVKFLNGAGQPTSSNMYDSAIYGYNIDYKKFAESFSAIGRCLSVSKVSQ